MSAFGITYVSPSLHNGALGDASQGLTSQAILPGQAKGYAEFGITQILHSSFPCPGGYTSAVLLGGANGDLNQGNPGASNTLCVYLQSSIADPYVVDFAMKLGGVSGNDAGCEGGYEGVPIYGASNGNANQGINGPTVGFCMLRAYGARR